MRLRPYRPGDCPVLGELFRQTVLGVNCRDYTPEQLAAWTGGVDLAAWDRAFRLHITLVAEAEDGGTVGFGDLDPEGGMGGSAYLDRLYVHRDHQGEGIARALCDALEASVPGKRVLTHASITARPFFLHRGYRVLREQRVVRLDVELTNFVMERLP